MVSFTLQTQLLCLVFAVLARASPSDAAGTKDLECEAAVLNLFTSVQNFSSCSRSNAQQDCRSSVLSSFSGIEANAAKLIPSCSAQSTVTAKSPCADALEPAAQEFGNWIVALKPLFVNCTHFRLPFCANNFAVAEKTFMTGVVDILNAIPQCGLNLPLQQCFTDIATAIVDILSSEGWDFLLVHDILKDMQSLKSDYVNAVKDGLAGLADVGKAFQDCFHPSNTQSAVMV